MESDPHCATAPTTPRRCTPRIFAVAWKHALSRRVTAGGLRPPGAWRRATLGTNACARLGFAPRRGAPVRAASSGCTAPAFARRACGPQRAAQLRELSPLPASAGSRARRRLRRHDRSLLLLGRQQGLAAPRRARERSSPVRAAAHLTRFARCARFVERLHRRAERALRARGARCRRCHRLPRELRRHSMVVPRAPRARLASRRGRAAQRGSVRQCARRDARSAALRMAGRGEVASARYSSLERRRPRLRRARTAGRARPLARRAAPYLAARGHAR